MDQQVKERMVGAAVLVLAAVIFIPMILAGAPQERSSARHSSGPQPGSAQTPAVGSGSASASGDARFSSRIVPLGSGSPSTSAARGGALDKVPRRSSGVSSTDPIVAPVATPLPSPPMVEPAAPKLPTPQKPPIAPKPPKPPGSVAQQPPAAPRVSSASEQPSASEGWVVQLGSFSSARNAHALRDRLKSSGYKAFARSSGEGAEAVTRVYVGPDTTREEAQQRVGRLLGETRLQGIVIRAPN